MTMRVAALVLAVGALAVGCSVRATPAPHGVSTTAGVPTDAVPAEASCPPTVPTASARVPAAVRPVSSTGGWYGAGGLWVALPTKAATIVSNPGYTLKFPSVTLDAQQHLTDRAGPPSLTAQRVDGPGTASGTVGGYAKLGGQSAQFWPTVVSVPSGGCWVLTEQLTSTTIRFLVAVG